MRPTRPVLALAVVVVAVAGCGQDQPAVTAGGDEGGGQITVAGEAANDHGTSDVSGESTVDLELDDSYFEPTVLSGQAGQALTVELENEGNAAHTFTIDSQGVDVEVAAGESGQAEVTFPDSGALLFYCRFHAGAGMRGGLSVGGDLEASETSNQGSESEDTGPGYGS
jgi:plastocyanin